MDDPQGARHSLAALQAALGPEYEVRQELGRGSMARVFLARNPDLGRLVAIKVLLPGQAVDETARRRFEREAKASASLEHPNVVDVYRFGRLPDQTPYLVMRFVKGRTMEERLAAEGPLAEADARRILGQVASALAAAHARGIVHRDVRPANILWDEERREALLSDFGIAAITATSGQDATRLTMEGEIIGNPRYQAPEQLLDEDVTELADIYAFGITGYELLTGEGPHRGGSTHQLIAARLSEAPRDLRELRPGVDPALANVLGRCLAREPKHRPSARDVMRALELPASGEVSAGGTRGRGEAADLNELIRRRVPQIVLITLGIGWGFMTLVDQLVDRGVLADVFYPLTLVFAICGIVASTVVAWFHGERGRQQVRLVEYLLLGGIAALWIALSAWIVLVS